MTPATIQAIRTVCENTENSGKVDAATEFDWLVWSNSREIFRRTINAQTVLALIAEIERLEKLVQRPPTENESVCHECNGSGWVST